MSHTLSETVSGAKRTIGLITLGQTPRQDLMATMQAILPDADFIMRGALDDLPTPQIKALAEADPQYPLMTRLADSSIHEIDMKRLLPGIETQAQDLAGRGVLFSILLCSAAFPAFPAEVRVVRPIALLLAAANLLAPTKRVGIINPIAAQQAPAAAFWRSHGYSVSSRYASPYQPDRVCEAARELASQGPDILVLDCMSFSLQTLVRLREVVSQPVLLPQKVMQAFLQMAF